MNRSLPAVIVTVILIVAAGAVAVAVPIFVAWMLRRGNRWAPVAVTVVGIWACTELVTYGDALAYFSAGTSVVGVIAAWMPSARGYGQAVRSAGRSGVSERSK